ncbi:hypothetical protein ACVCH0_01025 [Burkholderia glumae]|uniref:hypothetical protein n=1 Tax=Burkholderia glumae TaxID=337 RepID=UPI0021511E8F|nr:hypothetical protein [Burkholderia glumae]UVT00008.1 hypothetical protein EFP19_30615 [Burkholderia glumae]
MSYDDVDAQRDAAYDEMYDAISKEVRADAIEQFSLDRLTSYYVQNPNLMRPAWNRLQEGMDLVASRHFDAATIFFASSMELFFRFTLLRPVVYGLVHHERLADAVSRSVLDGNTGFTKYTTLLGHIYAQLLGGELKKLTIGTSDANLIKKCNELQDRRNALVHHGAVGGEAEALYAHAVAMAVLNQVVRPMLVALGLGLNGFGDIGPLPLKSAE